MKICSKCHETKEITAFGAHKNTKDKLHPYCKLCRNLERKEKRSEIVGTRAYNTKHNLYTAERKSAIKKEWKEKNKIVVRSKYLTYNYGITLEYYNDMLSKQQECCQICKTHQSKLAKILAVDHCHVTGKVRGLLCSSCNVAIGLLKDNPALMQEAAKYVEGC